jgi:hypothetical protein
MPRAVYSTRFLRFGGEGPVSQIYTVPDGYVAVVRSATLFIDGSAGGNGELYVEDPTTWLIAVTASPEGAQLYQWNGHAVLSAGEVLAGDASASTASSLIASGYLLSE